MNKFIENDALSYINNVVILINREGKIIFVNATFEKLISLKAELIGQHIDFFINQLGIEVLPRPLPDLFEHLPLIDIEHIYKKDNGTKIHLLWSFLPRVKKNSTEGIVIIGKDITELKNSWVCS